MKIAHTCILFIIIIMNLNSVLSFGLYIFSRQNDGEILTSYDTL